PFDAEKFVDFLIDEGVKLPCDDSVESFNRDEALPPFYDETMYKRGQKFFHDNIFALFLGKLLGLLSVLAIPSIIRILMYTKMSGSAMTAYKRYMSTVFHMCIWYQSDFTPGSKLWRSVMEVKGKHNSVSKRCCTAGLGRINQRDMALTQFGFMGYALVKREKIGLHNAKNEDLQAFVHVWRVIGYVMGLEDRFNICRDSVEETAEICRVLAYKLLRPAVAKKDKDFVAMATYLTQGMWTMNPSLETKIYLNLLDRMLQPPNNSNNNNKELYIPLNLFQRINLNFITCVIWTLQFRIVRLYFNHLQTTALWLMKVCPFLAYYAFGYSNSHVTVLPDDIKDR
ncbi:uncharacterized protein BDFB_006822, partial [Asbolus verrucosus]